MTTKPVEGASELGNQIARLMAALTRAGQGNSPGSTPNSPRHRGHRRGRIDRTTSSHSNSHNGQTGPGQTASAHSICAGHGTATTGQGEGIPKDPKMDRVRLPTRGTPVHFSVSDVKVRVTWPGSVLPWPDH